MKTKEQLLERINELEEVYNYVKDKYLRLLNKLCEYSSISYVYNPCGNYTNIMVTYTFIGRIGFPQSLADILMSNQLRG